ncbi:MAG: hypothetical protein DMG57_44550 [Acidobacteria bacterium]|nr:MAG: hypothetical protein DMG57_44550 [Acidobacteriota bacterium]
MSGRRLAGLRIRQSRKIAPALGRSRHNCSFGFALPVAQPFVVSEKEVSVPANGANWFWCKGSTVEAEKFRASSLLLRRNSETSP